MKKINTILFGASESGKIFYENFKDKYQIMAFVDNNSELWGSKIGSIEILNPNVLINLKFEKIIITSQWVSDIKKQLENLGIDQSKILIPDRRTISKPCFEDARSRRFAFQFITKFTQIARRNGIQLFTDMGTLLGIIRENDLIPWDNDIDFSVIDGNQRKIWKILQGIVNFDNEIAIRNLNQVFEVNNVKNISQINFEIVFSNYKQLSSVPISINFKLIKGDTCRWMAFPDLWQSPAYHFEDDQVFFWNGKEILVPLNPESYLEHIYGNNWRIPNPKFTYGDYNDKKK